MVCRLLKLLNESNCFQFLTDFVVNALTCYVCDDSDYDYDGCQGFNETSPTKNCTTSDYCLSVFATENNVTIEEHSCAQDDDLEGRY